MQLRTAGHIPTAAPQNEFDAIPKHLRIERYQKDLQDMREAQDYGFELAMDAVQTTLPNTHHLDIFVQAMLATSVMHLALFQ